MMAGLDDDEQAAAIRFRHERDRIRYCAAHTSLRSILGIVTGLPPEDIKFGTDINGKPVVQATERLHFNLSHSGEWALVALSSDHAVGIDIEAHYALEVNVVALQVLSADEHVALDALPMDERSGAFFTCWTRKEALAKGIGIGLDFPFTQVSVGVTESPLFPSVPRLASTWRIVDLQTPIGYSAALAGPRLDWTIAYWLWPSH
jgi:4'-phosphopantetheinyl transferase